MLTCPHCKTANLKGSIIVETGLANHYVIKKNPARGNPVGFLRDVNKADSALILICLHCGAESEIDTILDITKK